MVSSAKPMVPHILSLGRGPGPVTARQPSCMQGTSFSDNIHCTEELLLVPVLAPVDDFRQRVAAPEPMRLLHEQCAPDSCTQRLRRLSISEMVQVCEEITLSCKLQVKHSKLNTALASWSAFKDRQHTPCDRSCDTHMHTSTQCHGSSFVHERVVSNPAQDLRFHGTAS